MQQDNTTPQNSDAVLNSNAVAQLNEQLHSLNEKYHSLKLDVAESTANIQKQIELMKLSDGQTVEYVTEHITLLNKSLDELKEKLERLPILEKDLAVLHQILEARDEHCRISTSNLKELDQKTRKLDLRDKVVIGVIATLGLLFSILLKFSALGDILFETADKIK